MTNYDYLIAKKENGELTILLQLGLPLHILRWLDVYAYHLENPDVSQFKVSIEFNISKKWVYKCYHFMSQPITQKSTSGD
ncbi:MAG: hypothetical protein J5612_05920 [Paludibacteraceae bacterium]|nr:hypothetical protein [Paludibacteraceae bacterium]